MYNLSHDRSAKWIQNYVEKDSSTAENAAVTTRKRAKTVELMMNAIWESMSDFRSADNEQEEEEKETDEMAAWHTERWWLMWQGDRYNLQIGTAPQG